MQPVYLICGVPGSGKTWVCKQLVGRFVYVPHDDHKTDLPRALKKACSEWDIPIITECPFAERILRGSLEVLGITVIPYFVVERPEIVAKRYYEREKKMLPQNSLTRASTIIDRAMEWNAPWGTSKEILEKLKAV